MTTLLTVAGGLLVALLVVGALLYLTIGQGVEWEQTSDEDSTDPISEFGVDE